jgi:large subunit ribosomal protein L22
MIRAQATAKYVRTSAQKAGLVLDLIRGKDINHALSALQFSRKSVARDVAKVLRSAVANAQQKEGFGGDVERLFVSKCHADNGPSMKRVRPAPMGRAFRVVKRTTHLTVEVTERPEVIRPVGATDAAGSKVRKAPKAAKGAKGAKGSTAAKRTTGRAKKTAAKSAAQ